jgi:enoyl-CoA hydratase/carnithine racemase
VTVLRIDREEALGALSRQLLEHLEAYLASLSGDEAVRALVITGTGRGFIAGADIGDYSGVTHAAFEDYQRLSRRVFTALETMPQITVAAVNGYALGGGFELALCCDVIVASERAKFGLPEIKLGLLPGGGGTQRLARVTNVRFTLEAVLTGRFYSAAELRDRGVINTVVPAGELLAHAREVAQTIADQAPLAVRAAKRLIRDGVQMPVDVGLTVEQQVLSRLFASADGAEGIAAFLDKRPPHFTGR